jgi:hypothetical protein
MTHNALTEKYRSAARYGLGPNELSKRRCNEARLAPTTFLAAACLAGVPQYADRERLSADLRTARGADRVTGPAVRRRPGAFARGRDDRRAGDRDHAGAGEAPTGLPRRSSTRTAPASG